MRIRINLKNCKLYVADICKCVRYEEGDHLTIKSSNLVHANTLVLGIGDFKYITVDDVLRRRGRILGTWANKKGDVFVSAGTLKTPTRDDFKQLSLSLKRN